MENFNLAASHAGAIQHNHLIKFDTSAVEVFRELRVTAMVVVTGWITITVLRAFYGRPAPAARSG